MTWRTHVVGGISALWLLAAIPGTNAISNIGLLATCAAFGALLPDLDARQSKIRSLTVFGVRPFEPIGSVANSTLGHRGFLHSLPGLACAGVASFVVGLRIGWLPAFSLGLGYASHLALDACTVSGIPGWRRRLFLAPPAIRIVTGSPEEDVYFVVFASASIALLLLALRDLPFSQQ